MTIRSGSDAARKRQNRGKHAFEAAWGPLAAQARIKRKCQQFLRLGKDLFLLPGTVPFGRSALYNGHPLGTSVSAMKAQLARFAISLIAMFIGLITFWELDAGWIPAAFIVIFVFTISEVVFRRLADPRTLQRDLEERVRNQHL
jgi:hypothetical protein